MIYGIPSVPVSYLDQIVLVFAPAFMHIWKVKKLKNSTGLRILNWLASHVFSQNKCDYPIHWTSQVITGHEITVRDGQANTNVMKSLAQSGNCYYQAKNGIWFEVGALWGPGCKFISANHDILYGTNPAGHGHVIDPERFEIVIGENCFIGSNSIILPGVQLGESCIVGAGSVVTKSWPAYSRIAGNPARSIEKKA